MRKIKYSEALAEATLAAMAENPRLFLLGEGIDDPKGTFGTTLGAFKKYGSKRVMDSPLSESAITGIGIGAAIAGWPNVMIHMRVEFLLLAMDQIINHAAKWSYMTAGRAHVPIVIRCIVGRGWGQAAQHSQSLHGLFAQIPGLKVMLPATPADAKGMLYAAIRDPNPVISIEHRWCYDKTGEVAEEIYETPLGKANVYATGKDATCVTISHQIYDAIAAREALLKEGIEMEIVDLRTVRPLDIATIVASVKKTGRLFILDSGHTFCGVSAEIATQVSEKLFNQLKSPIVRMALPDAPTPCSSVLEKAYYPSADDLVKRVRSAVHGTDVPHSAPSQFDGAADHKPFSGPF